MKKTLILPIICLLGLTACSPTGNGGGGGEGGEGEKSEAEIAVEKGIEATRKVTSYFYSPTEPETPVVEGKASKSYKRSPVSSDSEIFTDEFLLKEYTMTTISTTSIPLCYMKLFELIMSNPNFVYHGIPTELTIGVPEGEGNKALSYIQFTDEIFTMDMRLLDINAYVHMDVLLEEGALSAFDLYARGVGFSSEYADCNYSLYAHFEAAKLYLFSIAVNKNTGNAYLPNVSMEQPSDVAKYCYDKILAKENAYDKFIKEKGQEKNDYDFLDCMLAASEWQNEYIAYASEGNLPVSDCNHVTEEDFNQQILFNHGDSFGYSIRISDGEKYNENHDIVRKGNALGVSYFIYREVTTEKQEEKDGPITEITYNEEIRMTDYYSVEDGNIFKYEANLLEGENQPVYYKSKVGPGNLFQLNMVDLSSYKFSDFTFDAGVYNTNKSILIGDKTFNGFRLYFVDGKLMEISSASGDGESGFVIPLIPEEYREEPFIPHPIDPNCLVSKERIEHFYNLYKENSNFKINIVGDSENFVRVYPLPFEGATLDRAYLKGDKLVGSEADHAYVVTSEQNGNAMIYYMDAQNNLIKSEYAPEENSGIDSFVEKISLHLVGFSRSCFSYRPESFEFDSQKGCYTVNEIELYFSNNELVKIVNTDLNLEYSDFKLEDDFPTDLKYIEVKKLPYTKDEFEALATYPTDYGFEASMFSEADKKQVSVWFDGTKIQKNNADDQGFVLEFYTLENENIYLTKYDTSIPGYVKVLDNEHSSLEEIYKIFDFSVFDYDTLTILEGTDSIMRTPDGSYTLFGISCDYLTISLDAMNNRVNIQGCNSNGECLATFDMYKDENQIDVPLPDNAKPLTEQEFNKLFNDLNYSSLHCNVSKIMDDSSVTTEVKHLEFKLKDDRLFVDDHSGSGRYFEVIEGQVYEHVFDDQEFKWVKNLVSDKTSLLDIILENFDFSSVSYENTSYSMVQGVWSFTDAVTILGDEITSGGHIGIDYDFDSKELNYLSLVCSKEVNNYSFTFVPFIEEVPWFE